MSPHLRTPAMRQAHRLKMAAKRAIRRELKSDYPRFIQRRGRPELYLTAGGFRPSKNSDPAYRKSIWPASKIARRLQPESIT